jgi:hypothetical protein
MRRNVINNKLTPLCPYCKVELTGLYRAVAEEHRRERVATLCLECGEPLMLDMNKSAFRKPTDAEFVSLVDNPHHVSARAAWLKLRELARQNRRPPLYEQFMEYRNDDVISGATKENTKYAMDGFYAGAAATMHLILEANSEGELHMMLDLMKAEVRGYFDKE